MKIEDAAQLSGSYLGKRLKVQDLGKVHFDEAGVSRVAWIEQR